MKIVLIIAFTSMCGISSIAQQTVSSSGKEASGTGGTVSYTVGQVVYTTNTGTNGSVTQGIQQPFEISVVSGLKEAYDISLEFAVYPNPATDFVKLKIENYEFENLRYHLYDINGRLLQSKKVEVKETTILIELLSQAAYFLKVTDKNRVIKTFKIIKNNK
jgi:hypothetical protein